MILLMLRLALYAQLVLGLARLVGQITNPRIWDLHIGLGVVIALLALVAFRPRSDVSPGLVRQFARFAPLVPLAIGLGMTTLLLPRGPAVWGVHAVTALATIALVETASGQQRRRRRAADLSRVAVDR